MTHRDTDQMAQSQDHAALLQACAKGDKSALKALMALEGGALYGVAYRMLGRRDLAEDAVQDAFVKIWRKAHQYDPMRGAAKGWVFTVLRNRCLTMLRSEKWEVATQGDVLERRLEDEIVEDAYARLDSASDLRRCLQALDPAKRSAVLMSYVLGYSHGEISGRMKSPLGSVKAWTRRGLSQLRECLS
ncbi:RNA polymerase sigma-70 factor (ECF subfamily) [Pacificibacter maritimus]|uniref:RNA polymerase sigma-70 factor (ECF subfamily) n=1 Tax=Pacificibacter maritimus TaxID=762213 RepID=A0A3N4UI91_9RHOB|nr:sigma-70 family RNA polymerase sigma factor [Pacificibacter maritimus]RPE66949.1 RNA polymerase sigma-70 factor (ECF subfamily) [Pacificibacter maritimus]